MRIALDTNVLVSGLLTPAGPPARVVDLVISRRVSVLYDDRILLEYRDVLSRPRLRIDPLESGAILELVEAEGLLVSAPPLAVELPDPDDLPFLEVAVAAAADALVSGNARDFMPVRGSHGANVLTPVQFLSEFSARHPTG